MPTPSQFTLGQSRPRVVRKPKANATPSRTSNTNTGVHGGASELSIIVSGCPVEYRACQSDVEHADQRGRFIRGFFRGLDAPSQRARASRDFEGGDQREEHETDRGR